MYFTPAFGLTWSVTKPYTYRCKEADCFLSFGFNTKIQRYHTSPSQISSFTLEPKLEEKGEEKRLLGRKRWGNRKTQTNSRCSFVYSPWNVFISVTSGDGPGCWTVTFRRVIFISTEKPSEVKCTVRVPDVLVSTLTVRVPVYMQIKPFVTVTKQQYRGLCQEAQCNQI